MSSSESGDPPIINGDKTSLVALKLEGGVSIHAHFRSFIAFDLAGLLTRAYRGRNGTAGLARIGCGVKNDGN